jgi:hypothetical protein
MKQQMVEQENKMLRAMIKVLTGRSVGENYSMEYMVEKTKLFEEFSNMAPMSEQVLTNLLNV